MSDEPIPVPELAPPPPPAAAPDPRLDIALQVTAAVGGGFVVFVAYQVVLLALVQRWPDHLRTSVLFGQVLGLLLPTFGALALAKALGMLPAARPHAPVRPGPAVGLVVWTSANALLLLAIVTSVLAAQVPDVLRKLQEFMGAMYEPLFELSGPLDVAGILLVLTIVPALCEEALFRGYIQRLLRGRLGASWSIGITAVMFAAVHAEPLGFLSRVMLGVGLGLAYERTGSLKLSMLMHAMHNLATILITPWEMSAAEIPARNEALLALMGAMPASFLAMFLWWRAVRALPPPRP